MEKKKKKKKANLGEPRPAEDFLLALHRKVAPVTASYSPSPQCVSLDFLSTFALDPDSFDPDDPRVGHVIECSYCFPRVIRLRDFFKSTVLKTQSIH